MLGGSPKHYFGERAALTATAGSSQTPWHWAMLAGGATGTFVFPSDPFKTQVKEDNA